MLIVPHVNFWIASSYNAALTFIFSISSENEFHKVIMKTHCIYIYHFYIYIYVRGSEKDATAKTSKDLQQKDTICISESKSPKATIIRHGTIIRLLLVEHRTGLCTTTGRSVYDKRPACVRQSVSYLWFVLLPYHCIVNCILSLSRSFVAYLYWRVDSPTPKFRSTARSHEVVDHSLLHCGARSGGLAVPSMWPGARISYV